MRAKAVSNCEKGLPLNKKTRAPFMQLDVPETGVVWAGEFLACLACGKTMFPGTRIISLTRTLARRYYRIEIYHKECFDAKAIRSNAR